MFRWVVLSLEALRSCKHDADYKTLLGKLPSKLSGLYDIIYGEIRHSGTNAFQTAVLALTLLQSSERLLSTSELTAAVFNVEDDDTDNEALSDETSDSDDPLLSDAADSDVDGDVDRDCLLATAESARAKTRPSRNANTNTDGYTASWVVRICRNLVTIDTKQDVFRFSHQSVREYIGTLPEYSHDESHVRLLKRCLAEMVRPRFLQPKMLDGRDSAFESYSMESWTYHYQKIRDTSFEVAQVREPLYQFLFRGSDATASPALEQWVSKYHDFYHYRRHSHRLQACMENFPIQVLHLACFLGSSAIFEEIVRRGGYNVNATNYSKQTGLHIATSEGNTPIVLQLIGLGADLETRDLDQRTPLHWAAVNGRLDVARALLATGRVDVNASDRRGNTPLSLSVEDDYVELAKLFLSTPGINADRVGPDGYGAMSWAALRGHAVVVKEILKTPGVELNRERGYSPTPLAAAAQAGQVDVVDVLLEAEGIDVNHQDRQGQTALHLAAEKGHVDVARRLLSKEGIRVDVTNALGATAGQIAARRGYANIANLLGDHGEKQL